MFCTVARSGYIPAHSSPGQFLQRWTDSSRPKAAEYAAQMLNKSDRTVRRWRSSLIENDGVFPESKHGKHQCTSVLWKDEDLNKKATNYVRSNAAVKGRPNLTLSLGE